MTGEATGPLTRARSRLPGGVGRRVSGQTEVVIDPSLTEVWRRRVIAAVVDLSIVLVVFGALTYLQMERLTRDSAGLFSPVDSDRWNALAAVPNRHLAMGDTTYVLAGAELIMTVLVTTLVLLSVYVLIPGYTGTSPGKQLLGLRVVTMSGGVVGMWQAALRTAVGIADFLPAVVPWALGARLAQASPWHQRLGDRIAGTAIIDARRLLTVTAAGAAVGAQASALPASARTTTARPATTEQPAPAPAAPEPAALSAGVTVEPPAGGGGVVSQELFATPPHPGDSAAPGARRTPPPPQHRGAASSQVTTSPGTGGDADHAAGSAWDRPRAEPAPVWNPTPAGSGEPHGWLGDLEAVFAPGRTGRTPAAVDGASLQDGAPTPAAAQRRRAGDPPVAVAAGARPRLDPGVVADDPVWNDDWQAWLYFDRQQRCWHRHDPAAGSWVAIA